MANLKPCPFCGKNGRIKKYSDDRYRAVCENFLCPVESFDYHTAKEAQDWWNSRSDRWIPCKERLPEDGGTYLVVVKEKWQRDIEWKFHVDAASNYGSYIDGNWDTFNDRCEGQEVHITYWRPFPEPPVGGDGE